MHDPADPIAPTPQHMLKPHLVFVGKLLGVDIYADVGWQFGYENKHAMLANFMRQQLNPPPKEADDGNA